MTNAELLAVALRARRYPRLYAHSWGTGPLEELHQGEIRAALHQHPTLGAFG